MKKTILGFLLSGLLLVTPLSKPVETKATPAAECVYTEKTDLSEGKLGLSFDFVNVGDFTFTEMDDGWSIQNEDGKYLAASGNKSALSEEPFKWMFRNNSFYTEVSDTKTYGGYWLGLIYIRKFDLSDISVKYYLNTANEGETLSLAYVYTEFTKTIYGEHEFGVAVNIGDGKHTHTCIHCFKTVEEEHVYDPMTNHCECGAFDYSQSWLDIEVTLSTKTVKKNNGLIGWLFGHKYTNVTYYTYTINPFGEGYIARNIEVSKHQNFGWENSNSFTTTCEGEQFYVRVTTLCGSSFMFMVRDCIVFYSN